MIMDSDIVWSGPTHSRCTGPHGAQASCCRHLPCPPHQTHVCRGLLRMVPSSRTMPTPILLAEPSMPRTTAMAGRAGPRVHPGRSTTCSSLWGMSPETTQGRYLIPIQRRSTLSGNAFTVWVLVMHVFSAIPFDKTCAALHAVPRPILGDPGNCFEQASLPLIP